MTSLPAGRGRALRVSLVAGTAPVELAPVVVGPEPGGQVSQVDGQPATWTLDRHDAMHAVLRPVVPDRTRPQDAADDSGRPDPVGSAGLPGAPVPATVLFLPAARPGPSGTSTMEIIVDGWRFVVLLEDEARAALRDRAGHERGGEAASRPVEVHAMIPGRIASIAVAAGQAVEQGDALLVIEAMKMQNELRAPRTGTVTRVAVEAGRIVDAGELLAIIE